ncbi:MAG: hypothetical protein ACXVZV_02600 [Terriglobales bacterium]
MPATSVRKSPENTILKRLSAPHPDAEKLAVAIVEKPRGIAVVIQSLRSRVPATKYAAAKALRLVSERSPRLLYPHFDSFVDLLDSDNAFLRWDAMRILANLAPIDYQEKLARILDRYLDPITEHEMIGAANCIQSAAAIAQAKPHLADTIAREFLKVEHGIYKTPECRNIVIGHAITALDRFSREIGARRYDVLEFVNKQLRNPRAATRKKAETFLKKWAAANPTAASAP